MCGAPFTTLVLLGIAEGVVDEDLHAVGGLLGSGEEELMPGIPRPPQRGALILDVGRVSTQGGAAVIQEGGHELGERDVIEHERRVLGPHRVDHLAGVPAVQ